MLKNKPQQVFSSQPHQNAGQQAWGNTKSPGKSGCAAEEQHLTSKVCYDYPCQKSKMSRRLLSKTT